MNVRLAKLVAALVVVAALISLAVIAIKTKGDSTETRGALAFVDTPDPAATRLPGPTTIATDASNTTDVLGGLIDGPTDTRKPAPDSPPDRDAPEGPVAAQLTCPAPLPPATRSGGVASLTPIIPVFGPFSAEAFAFLPAFEPAFPVIGPLFAAFGAMLVAGQPLLDVAIPAINAGEQSGYEAIEPVYGQLRPQVLTGEAQAAAAINPIVGQLAATNGSGCITDLADLIVALMLAP